MLFYWDSVGTIVPYDFFKNPEALGEHTRGLLEHELVKPIPPGGYIYDIPALDSAFADYLEEPSVDIDLRRRRMEEGIVFRIHMEKMGSIEDVLAGMGLAKGTNYPWFNVERETASDFMAYLASCLGKIPEINSMPVTDEEYNLYVFFSSKQGYNDANQELNHLRKEVLKKVFPAPNRPLTADEIDDFKRNHGKKLRAFRRAVRKEIIDLAQLRQPEHRQRRIEIFEDEIQELAEDLKAKFRESGFLNEVFSKLCPLLGTIPGAPFVFKFDKNRKRIHSYALDYPPANNNYNCCAG